MSKGKGKKNRRAGKVQNPQRGNLPGDGMRLGPAVPAAQSTFPAAQVATSTPMKSLASSSLAMASTSAVNSGNTFTISTGADQEIVFGSALWWKSWGLKLAIIALFVVGIYWIAAALFSNWGFNLWENGHQTWQGGMLCFAVGVALLAGGWYLSSPDPHSPEKPLTAAERQELVTAGNAHLQSGQWWMIGGLVVTGFTYWLAGNGGTVIIAWGAVVFGAIECLQGYLQVRRYRE